MPYHDTGTQMIPAAVQPAQPPSANADPLPPDMSMEEWAELSQPPKIMKLA